MWTVMMGDQFRGPDVPWTVLSEHLDAKTDSYK